MSGAIHSTALDATVMDTIASGLTASETAALVSAASAKIAFLEHGSEQVQEQGFGQNYTFGQEQPQAQVQIEGLGYGQTYTHDHKEKPASSNQQMEQLAQQLTQQREVAAAQSQLYQRHWPFERKQLLIVEDDGPQLKSLMALIEGVNVKVSAVTTGTEALAQLEQQCFDGMVLDLTLPDMSGFELLEHISKLKQHQTMPIIIYTGRVLNAKQETELRQRVQSIIIKDVKSPERLLQETMLLLSKMKAERAAEEQPHIAVKDDHLSGKRILLVDDDVRNVYTLSSVLEQYDMNVTYAENGAEALQLLEQEQHYDLILMDMMMPEMDGYEAMRRIRSSSAPNMATLPIIALTAKAMKEDRDKCIEAGASDYVSKPFETEQLLSLMRVWLYR
ncbi:response regulator [Paenibacillus sp. 481]|nr:response regulator [Paenibacillus sp. 481]